jgi:hypothetical protein
MEVAVPSFMWPLVLGANVLLITALVLAAQWQEGAHARGAFRLGALLTAWFAAALALSARGVFVGGANQPPAIALGVLPPLVVGGLMLALSRSVRAEALAIPAPWLVAIQSLRAVGIVFVVLLGDGVLPRQFALPAGWGDFTVGAAAPLVALALARKRTWARPLAMAWNLLGISDLLVALTMGALSAPGAIRVFQGAASTAAMARLPLSMVPVFAVPIFLLLHVVSLLGLLRGQVAGTMPRSRRALEGNA